LGTVTIGAAPGAGAAAGILVGPSVAAMGLEVGKVVRVPVGERVKAGKGVVATRNAESLPVTSAI
jgi:hypothetical protein